MRVRQRRNTEISNVRLTMLRAGWERLWCMGIVLIPGVLMAQAGDVVGETADMAVAAQHMSWQEIIEAGGVLMYVLAAVSVLTLAMVLYFAVVLRRGQVAPRPLHRELVEKIKAGDLDDARRVAEYRLCPLSHIVISAIEYVRHVPNPDPMMVRDVIEGEGTRQAENIQGQTQYLLDVAVVAPMIGLLGTVFGMLRAFSAVALDIAQAKPIVLAAGVSQALITTAFGLIVGIPAMVFYAFFRRRAAKVVSTMEASASEILTAMVSKGQAVPSKIQTVMAD